MTDDWREGWKRVCAIWNQQPRRVEGGGFIRWYDKDELVCEVTTEAYYRKGHVHPEGCPCDALVHNPDFDPWKGGLPKNAGS